MSDRPNKDLIEKVRKILSRTEESGCTQAEAEAALKMASRLMAEHNLSLDEIAKSEGESGVAEWIEGNAYDSSRWTQECNITYFIVKEFFFVEGYIRSTRVGGKLNKALVFFGKSHNVEAARWAFGALMDAYDRLFAEHRRSTGAPAGDRRLFTVGVADGFRDKMREDRKAQAIERDLTTGTTGTALALRSIQEETAQKFLEANPKIGKARSNFAPMRGSQSALEAGYAAGRNLTLNRSIGGGSSGAKGLPSR